jgi:3-hydroxyacyl-CoA dehydrogenase
MNKDAVSAKVRYEKVNEIGVIVIDSPPVNAISDDVVVGLSRALLAFEADTSSKALVICCHGKTFVAGADIKDFERDDFSATPFNQMLLRLENQKRPVVAALHGHVLGGGLELAMACHARVALPNTRLGLPEIKLGLLPGSLGTQRLPRLIPVDAALNMMLSGESISAEQALSLALIDAVETGVSSLEIGLAFARSVLKGDQ